MRVLVVHSHYRERGGEDTSFETEVRLLRDLGHEVRTEEFRNADLESLPALRRAGTVLWNRPAAARVAAAIAASRCDTVYLNNLFPALSGSVVRACTEAGVGTVLAVRNYRMSCVRGTFFRDGAPCHDCAGHAVPTAAVRHRCFQDAAAASAVAAAAVRTTLRMVRAAPCIVLAPVSEHVAAYCRGLGIPADRVLVKPNTVFPAPAAQLGPGAGLAVVGRLEPEKGVLEAIAAFRAVRRPGEELVVIGDGSLGPAVAALAGDGVVHVPRLGHAEVLRTLARSRASLVPSTWDEPFGRVAAESLACGTPAVVSRRGGLADAVEDGRSGLLAGPTAADLRAAIDAVLHEPYWAESGRRAARSRFDAVFAPAAVGQRLVDVLERAAASGRASTSA